ncbi:acyltransferase [Alkanindiges sp. WGS2144]|uniref:acyltransferase n=1 Tax=Alkanindiges sp. WGS2144 TaxID=3366808 RepID=UPI003752DC84
MQNRKVKEKLRGLTIATAITSSTFLHGPPVLALGLLKTLIPSSKIDEMAIGLTNSWLGVNNWLVDHVLPEIDWQITLPTDLSLQGRYLLMCNHQSWVDTTVTQYVGLTRMPLTRFFTKWELIFIPFLGLAFKILGFPMMKRHSKQAIAKNPALKKQDLEEARRACSNLRSQPYTLLNYLEGTRFTPKKHQEQNSPYKHLLKPKTGGIALALQILGKEIDALMDMTIVYPDGIPTYGDFWTGRVRRIGVDIRKIELPAWVLDGNYEEDMAYRERFQEWITTLWQDKDQRIEQMLQQFKERAESLSPAMRSLPHQTTSS